MHEKSDKLSLIKLNFDTEDKCFLEANTRDKLSLNKF